jgi:hypothetical protein
VHSVEEIAVPLEYVLTAFGTITVLLIGLLLRWIRNGFVRNESEHEKMWAKMSRGFYSVEHRIDHIIRYHGGIPPYPKDEDDEP